MSDSLLPITFDRNLFLKWQKFFRSTDFVLYYVRSTSGFTFVFNSVFIIHVFDQFMVFNATFNNSSVIPWRSSYLKQNKLKEMVDMWLVKLSTYYSPKSKFSSNLDFNFRKAQLVTLPTKWSIPSPTCFTLTYVFLVNQCYQ